jgi:tripartite-type tricarboxylate transporter receptor subunit TctC
MVHRYIKAFATVALLALLIAPTARAQTNYPEQTIRILVGFPPGGPPDIAARVLAEKFTDAWGKSVVVENVTGGGGNLAVERVAKAAPDGYTLVMANSAIVINPALYDKLPYDPVGDLAPISLAVFTPIILVVHNDVPARSVQELVALARVQPGKLTFGSAGGGTPSRLAGELFRSMAGIDVQHVPYRGNPALLPDLLSGRITMAFPNIAVVLPQLREGKLRALAVTSPTRAASAPDLPTMAEAGFPGFDATAWFGLMAPAGTPNAIVDKLGRETARVLSLPDVRKRLDDLGMEVIAGTPTQFSAVIASEIPKWAKVVKDAGIKVSD